MFKWSQRSVNNFYFHSNSTPGIWYSTRALRLTSSPRTCHPALHRRAYLHQQPACCGGARLGTPPGWHFAVRRLYEVSFPQSNGSGCVEREAEIGWMDDAPLSVVRIGRQQRANFTSCKLCRIISYYIWFVSLRPKRMAFFFILRPKYMGERYIYSDNRFLVLK